MRRSFIALSSLTVIAILAACSANGSKATDDDGTNPSMPTVDSGKKGKPVNGGDTTGDDDDDDDDDDDTTPTDGGVKDAGKDSGGFDAGKDSGPKDAGVDSGFDAGSGDGGPCSFNGILAKYDLSALTGNTATAPATMTNGGVTAGPISRTGLTVASASGAMNASGFPTSATLDAGKYYSFTLTAPAGCAFTTNAVIVNLKASGTGPSKAAVGTSQDAYATTVNAPITEADTAVAVATDTAAGQTLEVRLYGYGAGASGGTLRVQNAVTINGALH